MFLFAMCILAKKCQCLKDINQAIGLYQFFMFVFGFVTLFTQGVMFTNMTKLDLVDLEIACQSSPHELENMRRNNSISWLIVPLAKMANEYDDAAESMLNGVMCTDTCPCYQQVSTDSAYQKYKDLPESYMNLFDRTFDSESRKKSHRKGHLIPFTWVNDRSKSFENFHECYNHYGQKLNNTYHYKNEIDRRNRRNGILRPVD